MDISGYFLTVVGSAALGIAADILTDAFSKGKHGIEKYIKFGVSMCIASCMLLPLIRLFATNTNISFDKYFTKGSESTYAENDSLYILEYECEEKLAEKIYTEIGIKAADISIEMEMQSDIPNIIGAEITLSSCDADKSSAVIEAARNALGTNTEITIAYKEN